MDMVNFLHNHVSFFLSKIIFKELVIDSISSFYQVLNKVAFGVSVYDIKQLKFLYVVTVSQELKLDASLRIFLSLFVKCFNLIWLEFICSR